MKRSLLALASVLTVALTSYAESIDFDLNDPKGVNNIVFLLDAPLESINGTATGITGNVSYDPSNPAATTGKIVVAVGSMSVANPKMLEHIMGRQWMNAKKFPKITFELTSLADIDQNGDKVQAKAVGVMSIKDVSKDLEIPVSFTYLKGKLKDRQDTPGDILVVRSSFSITRGDFNVNAGKNLDKVADEVELRLSLAGIAPSS